MSQTIKRRAFGGDVAPQVKNKIRFRQSLAKTSNLEDADSIFQSVGGNINDVDFHDFNFVDYENIYVDLSSRTPFARMWTAVSLSEITNWEDDKGGELSLGSSKLAHEWKEERHIKIKKGDKDAIKWKNAFLEKFGDDTYKVKYLEEKGTDTTKVYTVGNHVLNNLEYDGNIHKSRSDTSTILFPHEHETDKNQFLKPPAGITSISSRTEGPWGALKKTTINFTVHNYTDFDTIYNRYFLRPGAQIFVDFGWDKQSLYNPQDLIDDELNIDENLYGEGGYVSLSNGDLETIFGLVISYDAKNRKDGGFDCSVEIISKNELLLSNISENRKEKIKQTLDLEILASNVSKVTNMNDLYKEVLSATATLKDDKLTATNKLILDLAETFFGTSAHILPGDPNSARSQLSLETGIFIHGSKEDSKIVYINWGWVEDNILNGEFGYSDSRENLINTTSDSIDSDRGQTLPSVNSENEFMTYNSVLHQHMRDMQFRDREFSFIYPESWGGAQSSHERANTRNSEFTKTFNAEGARRAQGGTRDWRCDQKNSNGEPLFKWLHEEGKCPDPFSNLPNQSTSTVGDIDVKSQMGYVTTGGMPTYNTKKGAVHEDRKKLVKDLGYYEIPIDELDDKVNMRIPIREIFVNTKVIKEALTTCTNVKDLLNKIFEEIRKDSAGIIDNEAKFPTNTSSNLGTINLTLKPSSYSQHDFSVIDRGTSLLSNSKKSDKKLSGYDSPNVLFDDLLMFNPYSPDTIVKEYELSFSMPKGGMSDMIALQTTVSLKDIQSLSSVLDGYIEFEKLQRLGLDNPNTFVSYKPSVGIESGVRLKKSLKQDATNLFGHRKDELLFNDKPTRRDLNGHSITPDPDASAEEIKDFQETENLASYSQLLFDAYMEGSAGLEFLDDSYSDIFKGDSNYDENMRKLAQNQHGGGMYAKYVDDITKMVRETVSDQIEVDNEKQKEATTQSGGDQTENAIKEAGLKGEVLVEDPTKYWQQVSGMYGTKLIQAPLPIEASLTIDGISGLAPGDLIRISYLPKKYFNSVYFQIIKVSHDVSSTWNTSITTQMKILPRSISEPDSLSSFDSDVVVNKQFLVKEDLHHINDVDSSWTNWSGLIEWNFLNAVGNLQPIRPKKLGKNGGKRPLNIEYIFKTQFNENHDYMWRIKSSFTSTVGGTSGNTSEKAFGDSVRDTGKAAGSSKKSPEYTRRLKLFQKSLYKVQKWINAKGGGPGQLSDDTRPPWSTMVTDFGQTDNNKVKYGFWYGMPPSRKKANGAYTNIPTWDPPKDPYNPDAEALIKANGRMINHGADVYIVYSKNRNVGGDLNGAPWIALSFDPSNDWTPLDEMFSHFTGTTKIPTIWGCTDTAATNYDENATTDDGSCAYAPIYGCMDPVATNYDPMANIGMGTEALCEYGSDDETLGCKDETACNYDKDADWDDGNCEYPKEYCYVGRNRRLQKISNSIGVDLPILKAIIKVAGVESKPLDYIKFRPHIFLAANAIWKKGRVGTSGMSGQPDSLENITFTNVRTIETVGGPVDVGVAVGRSVSQEDIDKNTRAGRPSDFNIDAKTQVDCVLAKNGLLDLPKFELKYSTERKCHNFSGLDKMVEYKPNVIEEEGQLLDGTSYKDMTITDYYIHGKPTMKEYLDYHDIVDECKGISKSGGNFSFNLGTRCERSEDHIREHTELDAFITAFNINPLGAIISTTWGTYEIAGEYFFNISDENLNDLRKNLEGVVGERGVDISIKEFFNNPEAVGEELLFAKIGTNRDILDALRNQNWKKFAKWFWGPNCCSGGNDLHKKLQQEFESYIDIDGSLCDYNLGNYMNSPTDVPDEFEMFANTKFYPDTLKVCDCEVGDNRNWSEYTSYADVPFEDAISAWLSGNYPASEGHITDSYENTPSSGYPERVCKNDIVPVYRTTAFDSKSNQTYQIMTDTFRNPPLIINDDWMFIEDAKMTDGMWMSSPPPCEEVEYCFARGGYDTEACNDTGDYESGDVYRWFCPESDMDEAEQLGYITAEGREWEINFSNVFDDLSERIKEYEDFTLFPRWQDAQSIPLANPKICWGHSITEDDQKPWVDVLSDSSTTWSIIKEWESSGKMTSDYPDPRWANPPLGSNISEREIGEAPLMYKERVELEMSENFSDQYETLSNIEDAWWESGCEDLFDRDLEQSIQEAYNILEIYDTRHYNTIDQQDGEKKNLTSVDGSELPQGTAIHPVAISIVAEMIYDIGIDRISTAGSVIPGVDIKFSNMISSIKNMDYKMASLYMIWKEGNMSYSTDMWTDWRTGQRLRAEQLAKMMGELHVYSRDPSGKIANTNKFDPCVGRLSGNTYCIVDDYWIDYNKKRGQKYEKTICEEVKYLTHTCEDVSSIDVLELVERECQYILCDNDVLFNRGVSNPEKWACCKNPPIIRGCMDPTALNYDPMAQTSVGIEGIDKDCQYVSSNRHQLGSSPTIPYQGKVTKPATDEFSGNEYITCNSTTECPSKFYCNVDIKRCEPVFLVSNVTFPKGRRSCVEDSECSSFGDGWKCGDIKNLLPPPNGYPTCSEDADCVDTGIGDDICVPDQTLAFTNASAIGYCKPPGICEQPNFSFDAKLAGERPTGPTCHELKGYYCPDDYICDLLWNNTWPGIEKTNEMGVGKCIHIDKAPPTVIQPEYDASEQQEPSLLGVTHDYTYNNLTETDLTRPSTTIVQILDVEMTMISRNDGSIQETDIITKDEIIYTLAEYNIFNTYKGWWSETNTVGNKRSWNERSSAVNSFHTELYNIRDRERNYCDDNLEHCSDELLKNLEYLDLHPEVVGCMDVNACNYDSEGGITKHDKSKCSYNDCTGECGGPWINPPNGEGGVCEDECVEPSGFCIDTDQDGICDCVDDCLIGNGLLDDCGVCNGDNSTCIDCNGIVNGMSELDECGVCGGSGYFTCLDGMVVCDINNCPGEVHETCTDPLASNFDPDATASCDSCCEYISGCTDENACNYDNTATAVDNTICIYPEEYCEAVGGYDDSLCNVTDEISASGTNIVRITTMYLCPDDATDPGWVLLEGTDSETSWNSLLDDNLEKIRKWENDPLRKDTDMDTEKWKPFLDPHNNTENKYSICYGHALLGPDRITTGSKVSDFDGQFFDTSGNIIIDKGVSKTKCEELLKEDFEERAVKPTISIIDRNGIQINGGLHPTTYLEHDPKVLGVVVRMVYQMGAASVQGFPAALVNFNNKNYQMATREMLYKNWARKEKSQWYGIDTPKRALTEASIMCAHSDDCDIDKIAD